MSRRPASTRPNDKARRAGRAALSPRAVLGFAMADVTRLLRAVYDVRLSGRGLTGATWRVLAYLYREDGLTQTKLADLLEVSRPAIGQMIDKLEASGFVERRADPNDRRSWGVFLSKQAHAKVEEFRRSWGVFLSKQAHAKVEEFLIASQAIEAECFDEFSEQELAVLADLVSRLRDHLVILQASIRDDEGS